MESASAGHSTIFASFPFHRAPNTADPSAVMRSTTWAGGSSGAIGGCGMSKGGVDGGAETVGLIYAFAGMSMCSTSVADYKRLHRQGTRVGFLPASGATEPAPQAWIAQRAASSTRLAVWE